MRIIESRVCSAIIDWFRRDLYVYLDRGSSINPINVVKVSVSSDFTVPCCVVPLDNELEAVAALDDIDDPGKLDEVFSVASKMSIGEERAIPPFIVKKLDDNAIKICTMCTLTDFAKAVLYYLASKQPVYTIVKVPSIATLILFDKLWFRRDICGAIIDPSYSIVALATKGYVEDGVLRMVLWKREKPESVKTRRIGEYLVKRLDYGVLHRIV